MAATMGTQSQSLREEMLSMGFEVTRLMNANAISYRKILMNTGVDRHSVVRIQNALEYRMDTYLKVIKYLRHGHQFR